MRNVLALLACVCLLAGSAAAAELVDNPAYQNWAKYKPGTSITHTQEAIMGGMNMQMEMTHTLKEITPDKAVVEMAMKNSMMPGGGQTHSLDIPAKIEADKVQTSGKLPEGMKGESKSLGKEKVTVGDKEYECDVTQFKGEGQGMASEGKIWSSNDVPGTMVKMEMKATGDQGGMESKMTLKKVEIK